MTYAPQKNPAIRNLRQVHEGLWRGGQPTKQQFQQLSELGVRTIISLRTGDKAAQQERARAEKLGMRFVHIPIYYLSLPDEATIQTFLQAVGDAASEPVFVHCFHGVDRTGLLIAVYRMARMSWNFDRAYQEMKSCGFHTLRVPHFKWLLLKYARQFGAAAPRGNFQSLFSVKRS